MPVGITIHIALKLFFMIGNKSNLCAIHWLTIAEYYCLIRLSCDRILTAELFYKFLRSNLRMPSSIFFITSPSISKVSLRLNVNDQMEFLQQYPGISAVISFQVFLFYVLCTCTLRVNNLSNLNTLFL